MNPIVFTIQAWEKEIEMHKERKPLGRLLTDLLPIRAKETPAARPVATDCTTIQEPVSACCD
jgi:hypothetical protein